MRRSDEVKFKTANEVDSSFYTFTAECLKDMAGQKPDQFRWDEEDQTLYMKNPLLRHFEDLNPGKASAP